MDIKELKKLKGVELWAIPSGANHRGSNEPRKIIIDSVGNKYVKIGRRQYTPRFYGAHIELVSPHHFNYRVFESGKAMDDYVEIKVLISKIKTFFGAWCIEDHLTIDQWRQVAEIIKTDKGDS